MLILEHLFQFHILIHAQILFLGTFIYLRTLGHSCNMTLKNSFQLTEPILDFVVWNTEKIEIELGT